MRGRGSTRLWRSLATVAMMTMAGIMPTANALACGRCAPLVRQQVFNAGMAGDVCLLLAPLLLLMVLVVVIARCRPFD